MRGRPEAAGATGGLLAALSLAFTWNKVGGGGPCRPQEGFRALDRGLLLLLGRRKGYAMVGSGATRILASLVTQGSRWARALAALSRSGRTGTRLPGTW